MGNFGSRRNEFWSSFRKNEEQDFLSTSLNFLLDNYTYGGDIKYIPNVISIISFVSVIINRSEK